MLRAATKILKYSAQGGVLVNASSAKFGGAREILVQMINSVKDDLGENIVVVCPSGKDLPESARLKYVNYSSAGLETYFFSAFIVFILAVIGRYKKVVSLTNVGPFFNVGASYTYFHQEKALYGNSLRMIAIRWGLKKNKKTTIVVQSERIKKSLVSVGVEEARISVLWPGVRRVNFRKRSVALQLLGGRLGSRTIEDIRQKKVVLIPIYDQHSEHKDFNFVSQFRDSFKGCNDLITISLCDPTSGVADLNVGKVTREEMELLYSIADAMLLASNKETLCLPMFEFAQSGRPIIAKKADYVLDFKLRHSNFLCGVNVFEGGDFGVADFDIFMAGLVKGVNIEKKEVEELLKGEWGFVND